jgi:hypothetical protein
MTRPPAKRAGAKHSLKSGLKWPCYSLHLPHSLQPLQLFSDASALQELKEAVLEHLSVADQPWQPPQRHHHERSASGGAAKKRGGGGGRAGAQQPAQQLAPAQEEEAVAVAAPAAGCRVKLIKKGAPEMKQLLGEAGGGAPLVMLWTQPAGDKGTHPTSLHAAAGLEQFAARLAPGSALFALADAGVSAANRALAAALRVGGFPCLQLYQKGRLDKVAKAQADGGLLKLQEWLAAEVEASGKATSAAGRAAAGKAAAAAATAATATAAAAAAAAAGGSGSDAAAAAAAPGAADSGRGADDARADAVAGAGAWDPPAAKFAKPGASRRLPGGLACFFPRMPCLRCGCPWWLGEDWDARCARCAWDCEAGGWVGKWAGGGGGGLLRRPRASSRAAPRIAAGPRAPAGSNRSAPTAQHANVRRLRRYDNDSQPLPAYRDKWERFVAEVREGRTAHWAGKAAAAGARRK